VSPYYALQEDQVINILSLLSLLLLTALSSRPAPKPAEIAADEPVFAADGSLRFPDNYREWVWLSSGFGMAYGPAAQGSATTPFDNVFVSPEAYRAFLQTGKWPDKTMLVLEVRGSATEGSINKAGRFQGNVLGVEVEVKDQKRFPGAWAFYAFGSSPTGKSQQPLPRSADCYSCHAQNGAVDNTFVQFYPTLIEVARGKGTLQPR
jgi:hypothetical protein